MPMPPEVGGEVGHDDHVADTRFDPGFAPGAHVGLERPVGLNRMDGHLIERHPKNPHPTSPSVRKTNTTTRTMSVTDRFCWRNGLKPMRTT